MSRTPIWCEIVCRECASTCDGQFTLTSLPRKALLREARRAGWKLIHDEAFCSQRCVEAFEKQPRPGSGQEP